MRFARQTKAQQLLLAWGGVLGIKKLHDGVFITEVDR